MRKLGALVTIAMLAACHLHGASHVTGGVLGRVVIYRNGVAFYERNATIVDGRVTVRVPRERVDDFLKSLTVVDKQTQKPIGVSIPRDQNRDGNYLTMLLETPGVSTGEVMLTYVTEAPSWKPSYRIVVGQDGKLMLEAWAVVDNTTSEDWKGVLVGVGASSALAFRYDLWSVRTVDRDLLQGEDRFAIAPPTGVSPYSDTSSGGEELAALAGTDIRPAATPEPPAVATAGTPVSSPLATATTGVIRGVLVDRSTGEKLVGATVVATSPALQGQQAVITDEQGQYTIASLPPGTYTLSIYYLDTTFQRQNVAVRAHSASSVDVAVTPSASHGEVIAIKENAPVIDPASTRHGITLDRDYIKNIPVPGRTFEAVLGAAAGNTGDGLGTSFSGSSSLERQYYVDGVNTTGLTYGTTRRARRAGKQVDKRGFDGYGNAQQIRSNDQPPEVAPVAPNPIDGKLVALAQRLQKDKRDIVVEVHGTPGNERQAFARGTSIKNQLVDKGIGASKIHIVPKIAPGEGDTVRVVAVAPIGKPEAGRTPPTARAITDDTPVGESHFIAERPMTVRAGSSAMVAMVHGETTGGVVYLYDPISERGDRRFAFKAVRLDNPTGDTLEPGPVTVYGDGRFIGEGITEPVPPHAVAVIPFALDKQVVIERVVDDQHQIAKLVTVQRGIITAEMQHRREAAFTVTSRLTIPTTVYLRHRLESGWTLVDHPADFKKVGDSHLFEVTLAPHETKRVVISEATPVERTFDFASDEGISLMQAFVNDPKASPQLKTQIEAMLAIYRNAYDLVDKIDTLRAQIAEYRDRTAELHAQVVTLKAVKTSGDLLTTLKAKLAEMADRQQKATIAVVETQEKLMLARIKFQNQLADLRLTDATASPGSKAVSTSK